jgi:tRNA A-37 threonylcarbamoyl transferase component Bud32
MELQVCSYSHQVAPYAACSLEESAAESFDSHLTQCDHCRQLLVSIIDGGVGPEWLGWCQEELSREPSLLDELPLSEPQSAGSIGNATGFDRVESKGVASPDDRLVNRRYRLVRRVGEGGMGVVWEGWDAVMRRRVALKELRGEGNRSRRSQSLFQEASSLARLSHPNIVSVFELFMTNERPTMVMEFIDGPTLSQWCGGRVIAERQAAMLLESLALAVQHAHDNGVIHRDLKPSNVLLSFPREHGEATKDLSLATPKLSDFGMARIAGDPSLTQAGDLIGTPAFMAPEQATGDVSLVGPVTDVYGLGATLYDLLTGTAPHVAETPITTLELVRNHDPISPGLLRPELSKDIETICLKCLRKAPSERYPSAAALAADLRAYLDGRAIMARPQSRFSIAARWCRRHKLQAGSLFTIVTMIFALVLGAIVFAKTEQTLRTKADEASRAADEAKALAMQEAERAAAATEQVQNHFRVTMGAVENIAYLLNATSAQPSGFPIEILHQLRGNAIAIFDEFLRSLPEHEKWTFRDVSVALRHAEMIVQHSPERLAEGRQRIEALNPVIERFEQTHAADPRTHFARDWHLRTASNFAEKAGDHLIAAQHSIKRADHLKAWALQEPQDIARLREYQSSLHYASVHSFNGGDPDQGMRFVVQSTEVAKLLVGKSAGAEQDRITYMHELAWTAKNAHALGLWEAVRNAKTQSRELSKTFEDSSPRRSECDALRAYIEQLPVPEQ